MPVLSCGGSVSLASVFEPVSDLCRCESGGLRQFAFLSRVRVRVLQVPLPQQTARPLLEAVRLLLAVPDCPGQRELLADAVLVDGPERAAAQLLRLLVVSLQPHGLQFGVRFFGKSVVLQNMVQVSEVTSVEGDESARSQDGLVFVERLARRRVDGQGPEEAPESLDVPALLQRVADLRDLGRREVDGREMEHHGMHPDGRSPTAVCAYVNVCIGRMVCVCMSVSVCFSL